MSKTEVFRVVYHCSKSKFQWPWFVFVWHLKAFLINKSYKGVNRWAGNWLGIKLATISYIHLTIEFFVFCDISSKDVLQTSFRFFKSYKINSFKIHAISKLKGKQWSVLSYWLASSYPRALLHLWSFRISFVIKATATRVVDGNQEMKTPILHNNWLLRSPRKIKPSQQNSLLLLTKIR